jgi:hypothetical protein
MPDYDEPSIAPPGPATVVMIVIFSVLILIASGYMIYTYSGSGSRSGPAATTTQITSPAAQ